jgi:hypothetical protein
MKLPWHIKNAIETLTASHCLLGPHSHAEAQRLAIAEVAKAERLKAATRPPAKKAPANIMSPDARAFWALMMTPLPPRWKPSDSAPIARPTPTARKQPPVSGAPKQAQPKPTEPTQPTRPTPLLYVSGGPRSSAQNITDEFLNSPATTNWRADEQRRGLL